MKMSELSAKSADDLRALDGEGRRDLFNMRFQLANGQLSDVSQFKKKRKEIARVNTALSKLKNQKKN